MTPSAHPTRSSFLPPFAGPLPACLVLAAAICSCRQPRTRESAASGSRAPVRTLRVLSYNIHHGEGTDGRVDLERIARVLRENSPDLVALQEVDQGTRRSGGLDEAAELARLTGLQSIFASNFDYQGGRYGLAILSRLPVVRHRHVLLPRTGQNEQRGLLLAEVQVPGSEAERILFISTHWDHHPGDEERLAAVAALEGILAEEPRLPTLLAGDLNAPPESAPMRRMRESWCPASAGEHPTSPATQPVVQIDYVLYRPREGWQPVAFEVVEETVASDHRPILAVIELPAVPGSPAP